MTKYILAIDQGTTSSRAILFDRAAAAVAQSQLDLTQSFPQPGWVEQDPLEMWLNTLACCRDVLQKANITATAIAAIGISNQRETTILWDRRTGKPLYPAIVWQDRRTSQWCQQLSTQPIAQTVVKKTGLLIDPYFSASKIVWLLQHIPGARERAERGELAFGTVDSFLLWHMTKGRVHATDATNASRTLLFNIHTQEWDHDILSALKVPAALLPKVLDNSADFGMLDQAWLGAEIPITGMAGDQQAATIGQACFSPGMVKSTYGTGCFMLMNTGERPMLSQYNLLATVAYRLQGKVTYGLEGSIFSAGVTIKWLRDTLKIIQTAAETAELAQSVADTAGVYLVPAFTGLGAPYWDPEARAAILGLTRDSQRAHIARAALESVCYQTRDLLEAMQRDSGLPIERLRVDGGMAANEWLLQFLANILNIPIERPRNLEISALGAAFLAGLQVGFFASLDEISHLWHAAKCYQPDKKFQQREFFYAGWQNAVNRVLTQSSH